jgi:hypothetical protein
MSQAVIHGVNPTGNVPQQVKTDGNGRLQVTVTYGAGGTSPALAADNADGSAVSATADKQSVVARGYVFNGTTWDRQRGDTSGTYFVRAASAAAAAAVVPLVAQGAFQLQLKGTAGNLVSASITAGATAGFLIAYNAAAAPAAGAALTAALVLNVVAVAAGATAAMPIDNIPDRFGAGIQLLFSTSLTTYTQPANPAVFLRGKAA